MDWKDQLLDFEPDVFEHEDAADDNRYCDVCGVYAGKHAMVDKYGMYCPEHAPEGAEPVTDLEVGYDFAA